MPQYRSSLAQPTPETRVRHAIADLCAAMARRQAARPGSTDHERAMLDEQAAARSLEWAARALPPGTGEPGEPRTRVTPAA